MRSSRVKTYIEQTLYEDWLDNQPEEARAVYDHLMKVQGKSIERYDNWCKKYSHRIFSNWLEQEFGAIKLNLNRGSWRHEPRVKATPELDKYVKDTNLIRALRNKNDIKPKYEWKGEFVQTQEEVAR